MRESMDLYLGKALEMKRNTAYAHAYKPHLHQELSVGLIECGETLLTIANDQVELKSGDIIVIAPRVSHCCAPKQLDDWQYTMLYITPNVLPNLDLKQGYYRLTAQEASILKNAIRQLMDAKQSHLQHDLEPREDRSYTVFRGCLNDLMLSHIGADITTPTACAEYQKLNDIRSHIEATFLEEWSLGQLSDAFEMNKYVLIRKFKTYFATTPLAYQRQLRVDYAKHLIWTGIQISDIALTAGFYDQAHFAHVFKEATGMTPKAYQRHVIRFQQREILRK